MTGPVLAAVDAWLAAHHAEVIAWRRHLHAHPELSKNEVQTTAFIADTLRQHGLKPVLLPGTGLYVDIDPANPNPAEETASPRLAFRADIDALPIIEETGLEFASRNPGISHACGHDVHTTVGLALACALGDAATRELTVPVRVIFQPAEEVMDGGAIDVIKQGALAGVGTIYALHAEPRIKVGTIGVRTGAITSATDVVTMTVTGPGGHTSRPHVTSDVVYALSKLVTDLPGLMSRRVDPRTSTVVVFGAISAGGAPNAIPMSGTVSGTVRTADIGTWRRMGGLVEELAKEVVKPTGCGVEVTYVRGVPPVVNDDVATAALLEAAQKVDPHGVIEAPQSSGGEDFSWFLEQVPGAMARLGCWSGKGNPQDLHRGDLVVDEKAIGVGIRLFASIVDRFRD